MTDNEHKVNMYHFPSTISIAIGFPYIFTPYFAIYLIILIDYLDDVYNIKTC